VARVIDKPLLMNGDAMEERTILLAGYTYVNGRRLSALISLQHWAKHEVSPTIAL
jgi:hypothetical protein